MIDKYFKKQNPWFTIYVLFMIIIAPLLLILNILSFGGIRGIDVIEDFIDYCQHKYYD